MGSADFELDLLGQQPRINRLYTQLTFCFDLSDDQRSSVIDALTNASNNLATSFPWTSGKVIYENGTFKIRTSNISKSIPLTIKFPAARDDESNSQSSTLTFKELVNANFPFRMLDESLIAPCKTIATPDATLAELPVFLVQANFISGGLLLTFAGQHGAMDVRGLSELIHLFSRACRGETFTMQEMRTVDQVHWDVLSGIDLDDVDGSSDMDHEEEADTHEGRIGDISSSSGTPPAASSSNKDLVWAYFSFSATSLKDLKRSATMSLGKPGQGAEEASFVSTDDVLTAFTWRSITQARFSGLQHDQLCETRLTTTLSRQIDMRRYLSLQSTTPGLMVQATTHTSPVQALLQQPISKIAQRLRSALDSTSLLRQFKAQLTRISRTRQHETEGQHQRHDAQHVVHPPQLEVRLSSWAKEPCYDFEFGFEKPTCVRRPSFIEGAREGLVYFLPKRHDGEIAVGVCLREDDMQRLREDAVFASYGAYVG